MKDANNPLGFRHQPWADLSKSERAKVESIASWQLNHLTGTPMQRLGAKDSSHHSAALDELKRFLTIKVLKDPHPLGLFSPIVAAAWHAFILDTRDYERFCSTQYGKTIHHIPNGGANVSNSVWMSVYHEWFGPFPRVWKLDLDGKEIPGMEQKMNTEMNVVRSDMDSDDGAFAMTTLE